MSYPVHIEKFEGPLDLLLQLIESDKLDITSISLMEVTEPFIKHLEANRGKILPEELADFLLVAAKLVYLKSKALLPTLNDPSLEEGPDLETQLRMYKMFVEAANRFGEMVLSGGQSYGRKKRAQETVVAFIPPKGLTVEMLAEFYRQVIRRLEPLTYLPKAAVLRVISLEEKIQELGDRVRSQLKTSFHRFLGEAKDRAEMVVAFLALLELIKQRIVKIDQSELFEDIELQKV